MRSIFLSIAVGIALLTAQPAHAQSPEDEAGVRDVIADWYKRVGQKEANAPWILMAPGGHDAGPGYAVPVDLHSGSAAIKGPYINRELAARALVFDYDIDQLVVETQLAKARVWERGYFYASAAQKTYENAASTLFVLEKRDGKWLILVHESSSQGIPPNKITDPMPDLRAMYYALCGNACDPAADAKKAAEW